MTPYELGQQEVYTSLGLTKEAAVPRVLRRIGGALKSKIPTTEAVKKFFIGQPRRFAHEWRTKQTLKPGSVFREGFAAPGVFNKALLYGFPLVEGANIIRSEPGDRAERLGGLLGGTALGLAAWGPTGLLGSMAAGAIGERLGRGLGRTSKYVTGKAPRADALNNDNLTLGYNSESPYTWR